MTDGDFDSGGGGDGGGGGDNNGSHGGGAFDLNHNGTSIDDLLLFAAITDHGGDGKPTGRADSTKKRSGCGCALPMMIGVLLALVAALT
jgi:hypothetical protein